MRVYAVPVAEEPAKRRHERRILEESGAAERGRGVQEIVACCVTIELLQAIRVASPGA